MSAAQQTVSHPFFAKLWALMSAHETDALIRLRRENLDGLTGRVLEVGAGTGTNFAFYPDTVSQVVAVEPEVHLVEYARGSAAVVPVPVQVNAGLLEDLEDPEPFDAVVCSLVLCSIPDVDAMLRELFSRLRPGGELRYLEHVAGVGWRATLQKAADATVWPRLFGNCHTHRHTEQAITAAGFEVDTARRTWTVPQWVPLPVAEFALGRAVRPV